MAQAMISPGDAPAVLDEVEDPGTPLEAENGDGEGPGEEDESSDDDIQITIGDIKTGQAALAPGFGRPQTNAGTAVPIKAGETGKGKIDMEAVAEVDGQVIYDLDIAQMEEKPWRKPGADVTDYFNYGFTEESWNIYCERQRKLRAEFGPLNANRQLFAGLSVNSSTLSIPSLANSRIASIGGGASNVSVIPLGTTTAYDQFGKLVEQPVLKTVVNLARPQATNIPPPSISIPTQQQPTIIQRVDLTGRGRIPTVGSNSGLSSISVLGADTSGPPPALPDLSEPPPGHNSTPPVTSEAEDRPTPTQSQEDGEPGALGVPVSQTGSSGPPGVDTPPLTEVKVEAPASVAPVTVVSSVNLALPPPGFPPPGFNMALPPPGMGARFPISVAGRGLPITSLPPPGFAVANPPPPGVPGPPGVSGPPGVPGVPGYPPPRPPASTRPVPLMSQRFGYAGGDRERSPASYSDRSSDEDSRGDYRTRSSARGYRSGRRSRSPDRRRREPDTRRSGRRHRSRSGSRERSHRRRSPSSPDEERRKSSRSARVKTEEEESSSSRKKRSRKEPKEEEDEEQESGKKKRSKRSDRSRSRSAD